MSCRQLMIQTLKFRAWKLRHGIHGDAVTSLLKNLLEFCQEFGSRAFKDYFPDEVLKEFFSGMLKEIEEFKSVFVQPDLTPPERRVQYELRQNLKAQRTEKPEKKWKIFRGRVVEFKETHDKKDTGN
ncbi:unnamed protein product [Cyprideis torosa]|uniref:Uncharacterized protein n=1 Tax=Cyprideis torosa TaxID=163714 RepID=A0A7R8ZSE3_9CRUS|nr:unnamed protein product [Cyprideis torosa]CAG0905685.1 unnamed protein product [Cyprideis torosa]